MPIQILTTEVASRIAAGEVIERPASVVKELVENSLDATSSSIHMEVRGGGVNLIKISDNGIGIPSEEAELAFQHHATSKLNSLDGLRKVSTLGFRGEALPSIAAVAEVELITRCATGTAGICLKLEKGIVTEKATVGCPQGTTVAVRNLFRFIPARLKFLKSTTTENAHIADVITHYSLAFPKVQFTLATEGREILHTSGNGKLEDVIAEVYGTEVATKMLRVNPPEQANNPHVTIQGYISPPHLSRASRRHLSFFINRRWIYSYLLNRAVEKTYEGMLMNGRYPMVILSLSMPPENIDVNVHPSKKEVRFLREQEVFSVIHQVVHDTLREQTPPPEMRLHPSPFHAPWQPQETVKSQEEVLLNTGPLNIDSHTSLPFLRVLGQMATVYIIAEGPDGLYLIDQHAAHERVLFEKILAQQQHSIGGTNEIEAQALLQPLTLELDIRQKEVIHSKGKLLEEFGFLLEPFGRNTYLVRNIPASLKEEKVDVVIKEILDSPDESMTSPQWVRKLATSIACHSAIRAGQILSPEEMRELIYQLEQTESPRTCPHGRPTMIHLSVGELEKGFRR